MPNKKQEEEKDLIRQPHGEVATYKKDTYVSPTISRRKSATTIVPRGGEIDQELKGQSRFEEAGNVLDAGSSAASGGLVRPDEEDPQLLSSLTAGTSQQMAPILPPPSRATAAPVPIVAPPSPQPVPEAPPTPMKLPGMPAGVGINDIAQYLGKQRGKIDRFGADEQMALQNDIDRGRNSFAFKAKTGLKGMADAIMQGVARAGNPGFQESFLNQENRANADRMATLKGARDANLKNLEAGMSLDQMDPNSALSKTAQSTYMPLFEKLGYKPEALQSMSASNIGNALSLMAQYGGMEVQAMIKQYELAIERAKMASVAGKQASDTELARGKAKTDAATEVLKRSGNAKVLGIPIPFTSDVSGKDEEAARQVLIEQMKGGTTEQSSGPYGQTTIKDGVEYEWSPVTGKYHRKG